VIGMFGTFFLRRDEVATHSELLPDTKLAANHSGD
jgi:hypothetical protein